MQESTTLEGDTVVDESGNQYIVVEHYVNANELVIESDEERTAITFMELANGTYIVQGEGL